MAFNALSMQNAKRLRIPPVGKSGPIFVTRFVTQKESPGRCVNFCNKEMVSWQGDWVVYNGPTGKRGFMASLREAVSQATGGTERATTGFGVWSFCFFGYAFARAWMEIIMFRMTVLFPHDAWLGEDFFTVMMVCAFIPFALFARKIRPLCFKTYARSLCTASMLLSGVTFLAATMIPEATLVLGVVAIVSGGIGASLSILLWAELHCCFEPMRVVLYVAGAFLVGTALAWLLLEADGPRLVMILVFLPILSQATLSMAFRQVPQADLPKKTWGKLHFPWKLLVVLGIYQLVAGAKSPFDIPSTELNLWGTIAASVIVLVIAFTMRNRFDVTLLYRTPFVLVICGLIMTFLSISTVSAVAGFFIAVGYALMFLVLTILLCDIAHTYGVSVLVLCGIQEVTLIALPLGHFAARAFVGDQAPIPVDPAIVTAVLSVLVVVATVALLTGNGQLRSWGVSFFGVDGIAEEEARTKRLARLAEVSETFGLSPREVEVLELILLDKNTAVIERELCIANGTLKSHIRRIYQKLDVHSREELRALLSADR